MAILVNSGATQSTEGRLNWPGANPSPLLVWTLFGQEFGAISPTQGRSNLLGKMWKLPGSVPKSVPSRRACPECRGSTHYVRAWPMGRTYKRECISCDFADAKRVKLVKQL
jgi:hypothetical protein